MPSWSYVFLAFEDAVKMIGSDTRPIVLINDPRRFPMPSGSNPIKAMQHALSLLPPNIVSMVVVSGQQNTFATTLITAISRLVIGKRIRIVGTLDDAIRAAEEVLGNAAKAA